VAAFTTAAVSIGTGTIALSGALGIGAAVSAWSTVASVVSLASRPKIPQASGGQVSLKLDPQAPIPVALGRTATGGYIIYRAGFGPKNKHLAIISALSTGPIQAIEDFYANDIQCTFTSTSAGPTTTSGQWTNKMRQFRLLGATSDAAYDLAVPPFEAELPGWTSAHKTTGFATSLWVNEFDSGRYPTGLPRGLWVVQGEKFYDPRLDSTYPGGSGSHRLATPSTWAYTENPYIMALGWILGRFHNSKKVWGCGVAASGIDWVSYVDGANVADANAWKAGGVVTTADDKWSVLTAILQAGGGVPVARGGQVSCLVSTPKTSVYSIASTDVIGEVSIQTSMPRRNRINKVVPKYRSEANRWQIVAADAVTNSTYLTEDASEVRSKEVEYSLVQQVNQAAQLAAYDLANAREGLTMTVTCKPRLLNVRVGEAVTITLDELGLSGQKCIVLGRSFDPASLQVSLTLRSETDAKHAYALGKTGTAPPSPSLTAYDPSTIAAPAAGTWTATGGTINNGTIAQPAILVTGAADDVNAQSVIVEYRPAASATYRLWAEGPASSTNFEITGVAASSSYVVAVSYRSIRGVVGSRIELAAVTTGTLTSGTVAGQGALATLGFVALGTNVRRADGTTVLTDAAAVTSLGTAAAITGQGAFATLSQAAWATQVTGVGKPEDYATKSIVYRQTTAPASPTLNDIWVLLDGSGVPQSVRAWNGSAWVTSADITSLNTASAIAGQGSLATANSVNFRSNSVYGRPQNLNNIVNKPSFGDGALGSWDAGTIVSVTGQAFTKALQLTPISATVGSVESDPAAPGSRGTRVTPGDKFFFDFWVDTSTVTAGQNIIVGLDGGNDAGSYINSAPQVSVAAGLGWQRVTGSGVIPASVVWVRPFVYVTGGTGAARFAEITISKAQPGADITSTNTAAAVTGQGPWATTNTPLASLLSPSANLLYNPTANLGLQNWTIEAGTFAVSAFGGEGQYFSNSTGATSPGVRMHSDVLVYANSAYSLSCEVFSGGLTVVSGGYAQARCYIQWLTAGGVHISYSATIALNAGGNWTYLTNPNQIAPATAATARITIDIWGGGSWTNTNCAWRKVKFENNSACTPFSDERTTGALYLNNATIDSLKPGEINANVTETRTASSIAGQGSLATLGYVALGSNVRRADATTVLTDAAAVTSLGTAAAIAGQAAWATYSGTVESVTQPGANLVFDGGLKLGAQGWTLTRTAYGYDPNLGALFITGLNNSMAQSPIFPVTAGAQYIFSANIGGTFAAGNLYAFIYWVNAAGTTFSNSTGVYPTSGAGFGRLSLAVIAPAGAVNGIFVVATGAGSVTQAVAYKMKVEQSNGSAASVFSDEATNGALYRSGVNIDSLKPGEINANVTETRTAAAITGQGNLATANRSSLAFGANGAINSDFARSLFGWAQHTGSADGLYTAARGLDLAGWFGLRHVAWLNVQSGATAWPVGAARYADVLYSRGFWTGEGESIQNAFGVPVKAGDRIFARSLVGRHRCDVQVYALVFDKTGTLLEAPSWGGGRDGGGSNGNPANFDEVGGLYTITNANAASMSILVRMLGNGGADPYAFITEPAFGVVPSGQTVLPAYQPGRSDPYADQTSSNTASAITGQGTLATANLATTALIAANAVTKSATARTAGTISLPASTWTTVQTASITTSGGDVRVDVSISADLLNLSGTSKSLSLRILRDGTSIYSGTLGTAFGSSTATVYSSGLATTDYVEIPGQFSGSNTLFIIDAAPSSGGHTYTVDVNPEGSATAYERNVFLLEIKR
jgi:hypothetical protein